VPPVRSALGQSALGRARAEALGEARRLMTVCNACRYCEGRCAVFPAMEARRVFSDGELDYLAHLCHACGACLGDCQFAPPHEFKVDVPRALAELRAESYRAHAWPGALRGLFDRNGLKVAVAAALGVAGFLIGFVLFNEPAALVSRHGGPGAFYRLMPHGWMAGLFGAAFLYALAAMALSARAFRRAIPALDGAPPQARPLWQAVRDALTLRYLGGGGEGCGDAEGRVKDRRRLWHHLTFHGFLLCFAATSVATAYHFALGRIAPYPWYDAPVLLGTLGGIGLLIGPAGLLAEKWRRDPSLRDDARFGMDAAFLAMLFLTSLTGLALMVLRYTAAMPLLLALHLGTVFALFLTLPYSKSVHGLYRFAALLRYARERHGAAARAEEG
jgi:citrate/tricarballylate utilization protein